MKRIVEINAAEGGAHSALFVNILARSYERFAVRSGWTLS